MRKVARLVVLAAFVVLLASCDRGDSPDVNDSEVLQDPISVLTAENFTVDRQSITEGESTTLRWNVADGLGVSISPDLGDIAAVGQHQVTPAETTEYVLSASINGQSVQRKVTIAVRPFAAVQIVANVAAGTAPLTVRLTPVVNSATAINRYFWDFEGDGGPVDGGLGVDTNGFDQLTFGARSYDVTGRDITFSYDLPGTYNPRVRVLDDAGNAAESTIEIVVENAAPQAHLRASPTSGSAPLKVRFDAAAYDNEGAVSSFEWDFDGDGVYDETTERGTVIHTYEQSGQFQVGVRLTDTLGAVTELSPVHMEISAAAAVVPTVNFKSDVRQSRGTAPLEVKFTGQARDPGRTGIVSWEWDLDGDGVVDATSDRGTSFTFSRPGSFYPRVKVTSADGLSGTDIMNIVVEAEHSLVVETATINPERSESSNILVSLKGTTVVGLDIEDASGIPVKTLWESTERPTGEYNVSWDGTANDGSILNPGDYYAVMRYLDNDGLKTVLDYRANTGGKIFYPSGWRNGKCGGTDKGVECGQLEVSENELEPFNNKPIVYSFTNPNNARVTAYMTIIGTVDFAPASFFRSRLMPPGDYAVSWFGEGTSGKFLESSESEGYLPAIFGITASDNAIFLSHQTTLGPLVASPAIVYPSEAGINSTSTMTFDLSRQSDVELIVDSTEFGVEVLRRTYPAIEAGTNQTITWDGRGNSGEFVGPGGYRLSLIAKDQFGQSTLPSRTIQRIEY